MSRSSFSGFNIRSRAASEHDEPDQWLVDAARRAGHRLPADERPAGTSAWRVLLSAGIPEDEVLRIACDASGADPADFSRLSPALASSLPHNLALKHRVVPVGIHGGTLDVATSNPRSPALERELAFAARQRVRLQAAGPAEIIRAQGMVYGSMFDSVGGASLPLAVQAPDTMPPPIMHPRPAPVARLSLSMLAPVEADDAVQADSMLESDAIETAPDEVSLVAAATPVDDSWPAAVEDDSPADDDAGPSSPMAAAPDEPYAASPEEPADEAPHEPLSEHLLDELPAPPEPASPVAAAPERAPAVTPTSAATPVPSPPDLSERLLAAAVTEGAAEAVLVPESEGALLVRLSIDGTLTDRFRVPPAHVARLVAALKRRATLDAAESSRAQAGRFVLDAADGPVHVRVTTFPITRGRERVLLRFRTARDLLDLEDLGFTADERHRVQSMLMLGSGLVVVAGPDGAGRTTTLYAAARELHRELRLDQTIEELVELPVPGVVQTELRESPHPTIASAVRALIETDGEALVVCAPLDALTLAACDPELGGRRLVLAPVAAADASATITRLRKLHLDRERLVDTIAGVIAQRLVRRLCDACAASQAPDDLPEQQRHLLEGLPLAAMRRPVGCEACRGTGYRGRTAIVEVMAITRELRDAIAREAPEGELAAVARARGMPSLWDSGLHRVLQGVTSLAELLDIVPPPVTSEGAPPQEDIDALLSQLLGSPLVPAKPRKPPPVRPDHAPPRVPAPETGAPASEPEAAPVAVARVAMPVEPVEQPDDSAEPAAPAPVDDAARRPLRVLLVDDDGGARRELARALTGAGLQVLQAADGVAALAYVRRLQPDVVLTEVALPGLDAIGLLTALAGEAAPPPVIVHTDQVDEAMDAWLVESGAAAVLRRDCSVDELARQLVGAARRD